MKIDVVAVCRTGNVPVYASKLSAGADLKANNSEPLILKPGERAIIPTGLKLQIPEGYEAQIRPRSGLAFKHGITILNSPGTIDADYRGEIRVILINHGTEDFNIDQGDRIAQIVFTQITQANFIFSDSLDETDRGSGGFGSTGI